MNQSQTTDPVLPQPTISVLIPVYNEEASLPSLFDKLFSALDTLDKDFEVVAVDDGSSDGSLEVLRREAETRTNLQIIEFCRNFGQTTAMMAGIDHARGDIIVSIDADLQNDPEDIPRLLEKLGEGFDLVSGWRKNRKDSKIRRNYVSGVANKLISWISGVHLHDYGCTLKAYRRDVIQGVRLYGEMHRFIPIYASWLGAKVVEIPVRHHPRIHGESKYGLERVFKVLLDLMVVMFLERYFVKPIYLFGGFGLLALATGVCSALYMAYLKLFADVSLISTPLPLLTVILFLVGILSILLGLIAEMLVRTYFESQDRPAYRLKDTKNS